MGDRVGSKKDKTIYIQVCHSCYFSELDSINYNDEMLWYVIEEIPKGQEVSNWVGSGSKRKRGYYEYEEEEEIVKKLGRKDRIRLLSSVPHLPHTYGNPISGARIMALNSRIYLLGGISDNFLGVVFPPNPHKYPAYDEVLYFDTRCPNKGWKRGPSFNIPRHCAYPILLHDDEGKVKKIFAMGYILNNLKGYPRANVLYPEAFPPDSWAEVLDLDSYSHRWKCLPRFPSWIYSVGDVTMHAVYDNGKKILLYASSGEAFVHDLEKNSWSLITRNFGRWIGRGSVAYGYLFAYGSINGSPPFSVYACHLPTAKWLPIPVKSLRKDDLELPRIEHDKVGDTTTNLLCINDNTFALVWSSRVWGRDHRFKKARFLINCTKFTIHKRKTYIKGKLEYYFSAHVLSTGFRTVRGSILTDCVAM